jgi:heptosyltransferase-2
MAQTWVPTWRKRLLLAMLDALVRVSSREANRKAGAPRAPEDVKRILVVELWNIGDVVLTMPFLGQLRVLFPTARISLLARSHARKLLENTALVDEFIETDLNWGESATRYNPFAYNWGELWRLRRHLRESKFDLAFKCRMHIREHTVLWLSGARRRIGYGFGVGDRVLTDVVPISDPNRHKVADWMGLLEPFGGPTKSGLTRLCVSESERKSANEFLSAHGVLPTHTVIGIHPGASVAEKRWPLHRFFEVASALSQRSGVRVLLFVEPTGYGVPPPQLNDVIVARVGLRDLIALISCCSLLVCNDSGPMHIAGGLGVRTVAIFGSGIASWFSPLGEGHQLISRVVVAGQSEVEESRLVEPFDVTGIPASRVLEAVENALAGEISRR